MPKLKLKQGTIVLFHGKTFLPRGIQFFMNLKRWLSCRLNPFWENIYNHAGMMLGNNELAEAAAEGIRIQEINEAYANTRYQYINAYTYPWSQKQLYVMTQLAREWEGTKYQTVNFLQWILNILSFGKIWIGRKGRRADNAFYCIESVVTQIYYATAPGVATTKTDKKLHERVKNLYHQPSPLLLMDICKEFMTLERTFEFNGNKK